MDGNTLGVILTAVGTLVGLGITAWKFRKSSRSSDANAGYDQIQEDLAALRAEFLAEKEARRLEREKDQAQIRYQGGVIRHLDDEIVELREGIQSGTVPPLPRRKPWPAYPGEWVESTP